MEWSMDWMMLEKIQKFLDMMPADIRLTVIKKYIPVDDRDMSKRVKQLFSLYQKFDEEEKDHFYELINNQWQQSEATEWETMSESEKE